MTTILRIVLIITCLLTCYYTLHKIRKAQMQIEDSIFWILISVLLVFNFFFMVFISLFPGIAYNISSLLGIGSPVNFVFLAMIFILLFKVFSMSIKISQLEYKIRNLVQQIAKKTNEIEKKINQKEEDEKV